MKKAISFLILSITLLSAEVEKIIYRGKDLSSFMLLKEGQEFVQDKLYLFVRRVYATGEFERVEVKKKKGKKGVILIVYSREKERIDRIEFEGEVEGKRALLRWVSAVKEGEYFDENKVKEAIQEIEEFLKDRGYVAPQVEYSFSKGVLRFKIVGGPVGRIKAIYLNSTPIKKFEEIKVGGRFRPYKIRQILQDYRQDLKKKGYLRARVSWEKKEESSRWVILYLFVEKGRRFQFNLKGFSFPLSIIIPYWEKPYLREWAVFESKTAIRNYLGRKGYFVKKIEVSVEEEDDVVEITYLLKGVESIRHMKLEFVGNTFLTDKELEDYLLKKNLIFKKFDPEFFREGIESIREVYLREGFKDFLINYRWEADRIKVIIKEGKRFFIKEVNFAGNKSFPSSQLLKVISSGRGKPYYAEQVQLDRLRIKYFYLAKGYRQTEVKVKTVIKDNRVKVLFEIKEGIIPLLRAIYIAGVGRKTEESVRRMIPFRVGKPVSKEEEENLRYRLEETGLFSNVEIKEHIWADDSMDLVISLTEETSFSTSFGAGWEERTGPRLLFDIILRNKVIRGTTFDAGVQFGGSEKRGVLSINAPYLLGSGLQSNLSFTAEESDLESYKYQLFSFYATVSRRDETFGWVQLRFRWSRIKLLELRVSETEVDRQYMPVYLTSFSFIYAFDRRDDPFNPGRGWFLSTSVERAFPFLGTRTDYLKALFHYQRYFPFMLGTLAVGIRTGFAKGTVPIRERFFAGGSMSFRGVGIDRLSPLDPKTKNPVGGKGLLLLNVEYRIPLLEEWEAAVFYDGGEVTRQMRQLSLQRWRNALGLGIRYKTPFGPIRLDVGFNLNRMKEEKLVNVYLTIGNVF